MHISIGNRDIFIRKIPFCPPVNDQSFTNGSPKPNVIPPAMKKEETYWAGEITLVLLGPIDRKED